MSNLTDDTVIISEESQQLEEVHKDGNRGGTNSIFMQGKQEGFGSYKLVNLTSVLRKVIEKILLKSISKHMNENKVTRN